MVEFSSSFYLQNLKNGVASVAPEELAHHDLQKDNSLRSLLQPRSRVNEKSKEHIPLDSCAKSLEIINFVGQLKDGLSSQNISQAINSFKLIDDAQRPEPEVFASILSVNAMKGREGIAPHLDILGTHKDAHCLVVINRQNQTIGRMDVQGKYTPVGRLPKIAS